ncbi:amidohydrolase family protein [Jiella avicenniae]|uniref:Amidohydrolase family protein n=1 Tax=Jiella avicenniae TaxID=2907202 RepID=A0A9X1NZC6_9HYPH|nr:amidohydrolase family protein [Jiella avicenniae]MCE7027136.1 amidohydrolase family protein [Jiella avicenniae]
MTARPKLVTGARVFDLDGDVDQPPQHDILIEAGRIAALGPEASARAAGRPEVERVPADGLMAIPGLVNAHYHSHDVLLRGLFEQMPLDVWGFYSFPANYTRRSGREVRLRTLLGAADCLANGITTIQDMVTVVGPDREHVGEILSAYGAIGTRVVLALQLGDRAAEEAVPFWDELPESVRARLPGRLDTAPTRAMIEELLDEKAPPRLTWGLGPSAPQRSSDTLLEWTAKQAERHGLQVFTHLYEARSQAVLARREGGSLLSTLERFGLLSPHLTIAHGVWIDDDEIDRFGASGASLACNPMSNMKLLNGFAPVRRYADAGANLSLGCDNCSGNDAQSLFQSMKMFALYWGMQTAAGETGAAREAFRAATLGGAQALGLAGEIGALKPGYRADMVLIDLAAPCYRPLNSALRQLVYGETGTAIRSVMVEGEIVLQDGRLVGQSEAQLKADAEAARGASREEIAAIGRRNAEFVGDLLAAYERADAYPLPFDRFSMR